MHLITEAQTHEPLSKRICSGTVRNEKIILHSSMLRMWDLSSQIWNENQHVYVWCHKQDQYVWPKCILHHKANLLHHKDQYVWPKCILHHKANLLHHKDQYVWPKCILHHKANLLHHKDQYVWPKCILHHKANLLHHKDQYVWPKCTQSKLITLQSILAINGKEWTNMAVPWGSQIQSIQSIFAAWILIEM